MDGADIPTSPRKRLKVEHTTVHNMEEDTFPSTTPVVAEATLWDGPQKVLEGHVELSAQSAHEQEEPEREELSTQEKETASGIVEYVRPDLPGFTGTLKKRYTDFLVNEILPSGQVVHLDDFNIPRGNQQKRHDLTPSSSTASAKHLLLPLPAQSESLASSADKTFIPGPGSVEAPLPKTAVGFSGPPDPNTRSTEQARSTTLQPIGEGSKGSASESQGKVEHATNTVVTDIVGVEGLATAETKPLGQKVPHEPPQNTGNTADAVHAWQSYANELSAFQLKDEDRALLVTYFSTEVVDSILALYNRLLNSPHRKTREYGTVTSIVTGDREARGKIHKAIREIFGSRLESTTDDASAMTISAAPEKPNWNRNSRGHGDRNDWRERNQQNRRQPQAKGKRGWEDLGGEYLHFSLLKENKDTMEIISYLARQLKVKPQSFHFAGTKDRRGVTVQRVSVHRIYADRMKTVARTLRNARIGNYEYQRSSLELGELSGNEFIITLRDCHFDDEAKADMDGRVKIASKTVGVALSNLTERGFINYYGLQRFGTFSTRTDTIGLRMLQGDFKAAVDAILDYSPVALAAAQDPLSGNNKVSSDDKARASALNSFRTTGKSYLALDNLPRKFSAEANIIRHLGNAERSKDYHGALQTIPRNLRLMYVHAYQSLIWNLAASERWKLFGDRVVEGDLVLINEHKGKTEESVDPQEVDADGEAIVHAAPEEDRFTRARPLTKEEAKSGGYTIFDVVLPTPGYDILYPANDVAGYYKSVMASERGGCLDPYDMRRKWKDVSLSGSYRTVLACPGEDFSFDIKSYVNDDEQFVETDLDRIYKGKKQANGHHQEPVASSQEQAGNSSVSEQVPDKIAVVVKLQLGSSQYATMALRELMKLGGVKTYKPDFGGGR